MLWVWPGTGECRRSLHRGSRGDGSLLGSSRHAGGTTTLGNGVARLLRMPSKRMGRERGEAGAHPDDDERRPNNMHKKKTTTHSIIIIRSVVVGRKKEGFDDGRSAFQRTNNNNKIKNTTLLIHLLRVFIS